MISLCGSLPFSASPTEWIQRKEIAPGGDVTSDEALEAYIRETCNTMYHPVGTCKIRTDPMAVLDPKLRVHRVEGLRVVDASIMPTLITGHTNANNTSEAIAGSTQQNRTFGFLKGVIW